MAVARRRELIDERTDVPLAGAIDGVNKTFSSPEKFFHSTSRSIKVYYNGQRLYQGVDGVGDYTVAESGGVGTGFDTVVINPSCLAPKAGDLLTSDYFAA